MAKKLSHEEFVKKAIIDLRTGVYKGIHSVYSGFNAAFRKFFPGEDPVKITNQLAEEGKIITRPARGGVVLYLPEDAPLMNRADEALKKMGLLKKSKI